MRTHTFHTNRWWRWRAVLPLLITTLLVTYTIGHARAQGAQLVTVTLQDAANRGLDQVLITLRSLDSALLAEGVTDRAGSVRLVLPTPADTLWLGVSGVTATGTPLQLTGTERDGIRVHLLGPETTLTLRVEDDGTVLPDPATMAEVGGAPPTSTATAQPSLLPTPTPDAALVPMVTPALGVTATQVPVPQQPAPAEFVDANGQPISEPSPTPSRTALFLLTLLLGLGCIAIGLWRLLRPRQGGQR